MYRHTLFLLLLFVFGGCSAAKIRITDKQTGQPVSGVFVLAFPQGIFPAGFPTPDKTKTDNDGVAVLANRRLDMCRIEIEGIHSEFTLDELKTNEIASSDSGLRVEYLGRIWGWPFRRSETVENFPLRINSVKKMSKLEGR